MNYNPIIIRNFHAERLIKLAWPLSISTDVTFRVYDVPTEGTPLWEETQSVIFDEGVFRVMLGSITPLTPEVFKGGERYRGFSSMIKEGERALALEMTDTSTLAGLLQPGDHIDIIGTFKPESLGGRKEADTTITLLQNVVVLAVGQVTSTRSSVGKRGTKSGLITVLVTPEEAELLIYANRAGKLQNVLRNPGDIETFDNLPRITFADILQPRIREEIQTARDNRILVIRGGEEKRERVE